MVLEEGRCNLNIYKFDGLICTDIKITFNSKEKVLKNAVIDTGAAETTSRLIFLLKSYQTKEVSTLRYVFQRLHLLFQKYKVYKNSFGK